MSKRHSSTSVRDVRPSRRFAVVGSAGQPVAIASSASPFSLLYRDLLTHLATFLCDTRVSRVCSTRSGPLHAYDNEIRVLRRVNRACRDAVPLTAADAHVTRVYTDSLRVAEGLSVRILARAIDPFVCSRRGPQQPPLTPRVLGSVVDAVLRAELARAHTAWLVPCAGDATDPDPDAEYMLVSSEAYWRMQLAPRRADVRAVQSLMSARRSAFQAYTHETSRQRRDAFRVFMALARHLNGGRRLSPATEEYMRCIWHHDRAQAPKHFRVSPLEVLLRVTHTDDRYAWTGGRLIECTVACIYAVHGARVAHTCVTWMLGTRRVFVPVGAYNPLRFIDDEWIALSDALARTMTATTGVAVSEPTPKTTRCLALLECATRFFTAELCSITTHTHTKKKNLE